MTKKLGFILVSVYFFIPGSAVIAQSVLVPTTAPVQQIGRPSAPNGGGNIPLGTVPCVALQPGNAEVGGARKVKEGQYEIKQSHPLDVAATLLTQKLGIPISHEEGPLEYRSDLVTTAELNPELAARIPNYTGPLVPRVGTLEIYVPITPAARNATSARNVIRSAIENHRAQKNPGDYKLVEFGDGEFSIAMERSANKDGMFVARQLPLDTAISFPVMDRTLNETIDLILKSIGAVTNIKFLQGPGGPPKAFNVTHVNVGANSEPARNVLAKALRVPGDARLRWSITPMPGTGDGYFFTLLPVNAEVIDSRGIACLQPLYWPK